MVDYVYNKGLYKCDEDAFYKKVELLKEMVMIYKSAKYSEVDKAYQLLKIYNTASLFEQKYRLLFENGANDPMLQNIYKYIPLISDLLNRYKEKGYEKDFYAIRKLERVLPEYEDAKKIVFQYIESSEFILEHIIEDMGISKDVFEKSVNKVRLLAPNLYKQYLAKKELNNKLKYDDMVFNLLDIANAIEKGHFEDGTEFSMLEFWTRVPLKENLKNEFKDCQKINSNIEDGSFNFVWRVTSLAKASLPEDKYNILLNFLKENKIFSTSKTMNLFELRHRYYNIRRIMCDGEKNIEVNFCEDDFVNIIEYIKIKRLPFILEVYEAVWIEYINGNITKEYINEMKNNKIKQRGI